MQHECILTPKTESSFWLTPTRCCSLGHQIICASSFGGGTSLVQSRLYFLWSWSYYWRRDTREFGRWLVDMKVGRQLLLRGNPQHPFLLVCLHLISFIGPNLVPFIPILLVSVLYRKWCSGCLVQDIDVENAEPYADDISSSHKATGQQNDIANASTTTGIPESQNDSTCTCSRIFLARYAPVAPSWQKRRKVILAILYAIQVFYSFFIM